MPQGASAPCISVVEVQLQLPTCSIKLNIWLCPLISPVSFALVFPPKSQYDSVTPYTRVWLIGYFPTTLELDVCNARGLCNWFPPREQLLQQGAPLCFRFNHYIMFWRRKRYVEYYSHLSVPSAVGPTTPPGDWPILLCGMQGSQIHRITSRQKCVKQCSLSAR